MYSTDSRAYEKDILNSITDHTVKRLVELLFLYAEDGLYETDLEEVKSLIKDK